MPATLSTITGTFPPAERTRAVGIWAGVAGGSAVLGLLTTGTLLEWFSWRAAFAVNVAIHAGGPIGAHARDAFVDGIHAGLLYAAGAAILAAIAVATLLTRDAKIRRPAAESEADQRQLASVSK